MLPLASGLALAMDGSPCLVEIFLTLSYSSMRVRVRARVFVCSLVYRMCVVCIVIVFAGRRASLLGACWAHQPGGVTQT